MRFQLATTDLGREREREREDEISVKVGFGHGFSTMDLEKTISQGFSVMR